MEYLVEVTVIVDEDMEAETDQTDVEHFLNTLDPPFGRVLVENIQEV